jgi:YD repeat-containing protein
LVGGCSALTYTWDDEDRLVSVALPGGGVDTFTYNGLGLRVGKTDSTGPYAYVCDGTSPGAPVLALRV